VRRLPWLGRFNHENYISVPGFHNKVVMLGTDDSSPVSLGAPGQSELYMYVAKGPGGVLFGNGKLYVFKTSEKSNSGELVVGEPIHGHFEEIPDAADASAQELQAKVDRRHAFKFVRLEDIAYDLRETIGTGPRSHDPMVYFVDTGNLNAQCGGKPCDLFGSIYGLRLDPEDPTRNARLVLLARSQGAETGWASPDNIAVSRNSLMIQEDPAYAGFNRPERIWNFKLRPNGKLAPPQAVVELKTEKFTGAVCSEPAGTCWESSGIIDASPWLGDGTWLFDVQAHTLPFSYKDKQATINVSAEGGQLLFLRLAGS
jgi:secreted PhoX family phosphatase